MSVFTKVLKAGEGKKVRRLVELVEPISALEPEMQALSDAELAHKTVEFRERLDQGETLDDLLIEAYAVVREGAWRVLGQRHFDVQLMGGMALHFGWIAEMKTGEGKTLVSTLPVYLNALDQRGVHVVTVNDYLATRDSEWMGRLHKWLGLTVGRIGADIDDPALKRAAYAADLTYGTNNEFGFDYLRDNMARSRESMAQRGHVFAIVDEVDSILIDEARTPLIISGPADEAAQLYYQFASIARTLTRDVDYEVDEEKKTVVPLESGIEKVEKAVGVENIYDAVSTNYVHQLTKALTAKDLYKRDKDYLVAGGEVKIIDEFTGRTLDGRRWSDGLHQAVEAKERVAIKEENHTWATVTLQNYFRMYEKLSGHDRHGRDRGGRVRRHLRPLGRSHPDQQGHGPGRSGRPRLQDRGSQVQRRRRGPRRVATRRGSPSWSAPRRWPSPSCSPGSSRRKASRTTSSTPSSTSGRPRWWPRPVARAASPSPPTWPVEASTSSWAATPSCWPSTNCRPKGSTSATDEGAIELKRRQGVPRGALPGRGRRGAQARWPLRPRAASATRAAASTTSSGAVPAVRAIRARAAST